MADLDALQSLIDNFELNLPYYKDAANAYNEQNCRAEYIDKLLRYFGWDVDNSNCLLPQYREVIVESYSSSTERPDYTMTLHGVTKFFVEAKKPLVDISSTSDPAFQARKYGWNANHKFVVLTNFEYLAIYDTTIVPKENDSCRVARYRLYNYKDYVRKYDEISKLLSRDSVYSGDYDNYLNESFPSASGEQCGVDDYFLDQINEWRVALGNELYKKGGRYSTSIELLNDSVQEFINQIVFLRICEDRNLPLYHKLKDTISDEHLLNEKLETLFRKADIRYNSGMFEGDNITFDLSNKVIKQIIESLYYPQSPYLFNIIDPALFGQIYEMFLTEQLFLQTNGLIGLEKKKDCKNRSIVKTPIEIVKFIVHKTLSKVCMNKTPEDMLNLHIADIACGSGIFLVESFEYLQNKFVQWYMQNNEYDKLDEMSNGIYKLNLHEKKKILCSCIFGIDIDVHAVEVTKFALLIKLIENETSPSVQDECPILPNLDTNIKYGNSLVSPDQLDQIPCVDNQSFDVAPFDWADINGGQGFDVIVGNPPYVNTSDMYQLIPESEMNTYKKFYKVVYKQFDKYYLFIEQAINKVLCNGYISLIVPNKFLKVDSGKNLRKLIAENEYLVDIIDFGDIQLFADKTIYSSIITLKKSTQESFNYSNPLSSDILLTDEKLNSTILKSSIISEKPWVLSTDTTTLNLLSALKEKGIYLSTEADIFNGIQTSAERPTPVYWFDDSEIINENDTTFTISRNGKKYKIEKEILKPYFKPTNKDEKGLNSYSVLNTSKHIIFPYDENGHLIPINKMKTNFSGTYKYLHDYYDRLVPKCVSASGERDVPDATADTWYQYGRTQSLTAFINRKKLIVGILSKEPLYSLDTKDILIASGGTAGYCAISMKPESSYSIEYIQAFLSNPITEKIIRIMGSNFENGFISRGTHVLLNLPLLGIDFNDEWQRSIYDDIVEKSDEIYAINDRLSSVPSKSIKIQLQRKKLANISSIENDIEKLYNQILDKES